MIKIRNATVTSLLSPDDLTDEQVRKIIIALAKMVIEENGGKDIKFKKILNEGGNPYEG